MRRRSFLLAERGSPTIPAPATGSPDPARAAASASSGFGRLGDGGRGPEPGSPGTSAVQTSTKFPCPPRTRDRGPRSPEFPCLPQPSGRIPLRSQGRKPTRPSVWVRAAPARWRGTGKRPRETGAVNGEGGEGAGLRLPAGCTDPDPQRHREPAGGRGGWDLLLQAGAVPEGGGGAQGPPRSAFPPQPPAGPSGGTSPGSRAGPGASGRALDHPAAGALSRRCPASGGIAGSARRPEKANFVQPGLAFVGSLGKCGQGAGRQEARDRGRRYFNAPRGQGPQSGAVSTQLPFGWAFQIPASAGVALVGPGLASLLARVQLPVVALLSTSLRRQSSWFTLLKLLA